MEVLLILTAAGGWILSHEEGVDLDLANSLTSHSQLRIVCFYNNERMFRH